MDLNSQEFKDMLEKSDNPEVLKAVATSINAIGETSKKNFDEINKGYEELKKLVDDSRIDVDPLIKEQVQKWGEDITLRQDEMDKAANKRMDDLEIMLKRVPRGYDSPEAKKQAESDLEMFRKDVFTAKGHGEGIKDLSWDEQKKTVTEENFENYKKSFNVYLRTHDDVFKHIDPEKVKDLSVGIDPDGGYTVTPVMVTRIIQRIYESDPIRQLAAVESITTGAIELYVDYDEAGAEWEGERATPSDTTTPKWDKKRIPVHILATRPKATQTLIEDSGINIESWLAGHVGRKFGRVEAAAFVSGDGVNKPRGFLTYDDYTTAGTDEYGKIEQISMGAAANLTADGFNKVKYSLVEDFMDRGTWLMNRTTVRDAMILKDGEGRYIWQPGLQSGEPSILCGLPLRMSTTMPVVAANALSVALADWAEAYMIVDRLGITVQRDPYTVKPFIEFYTRKRVGGDVVNMQAIKIGKVAA